MPIEYRFDESLGVLRLIGSGTTNMEQRRRCIARMIEDPTLPLSCPICIDVSAVTNAPSIEELGEIAKLTDRLQARFLDRVAIINTRVGHVTLSHLVASLTHADGHEVRAFTNRELALDWLCRR